MRHTKKPSFTGDDILFRLHLEHPLALQMIILIRLSTGRRRRGRRPERRRQGRRLKLAVNFLHVLLLANRFAQRGRVASINLTSIVSFSARIRSGFANSPCDAYCCEPKSGQNSNDGNK